MTSVQELAVSGRQAPSRLVSFRCGFGARLLFGAVSDQPTLLDWTLEAYDGAHWAQKLAVRRPADGQATCRRDHEFYAGEGQWARPLRLHERRAGAGLPTQPARQIDDLLPHRWVAAN